MEKIRVYKLAKDLNMTSKDLIELLNKNSISITNHMSTLTQEQSDFIKSELQGKNKENTVKSDKIVQNKKINENKPKDSSEENLSKHHFEKNNKRSKSVTEEKKDKNKNQHNNFRHGNKKQYDKSQKSDAETQADAEHEKNAVVPKQNTDNNFTEHKQKTVDKNFDKHKQRGKDGNFEKHRKISDKTFDKKRADNNFSKSEPNAADKNFSKDKTNNNDKNFKQNGNYVNKNKKRFSKDTKFGRQGQQKEGQTQKGQTVTAEGKIINRKKKKRVSGYNADLMVKPERTRKNNIKRKDKEKAKVKEQNELMEDIVQMEDDIFEIEDTIVVGALAKILNIPATQLIMDIMKLGIMANINQEIKFETAEKIALNYDVMLVHKEKETEEKPDIVIEEDKEEDLVTRPPIVTVMGHVDHGKTTLLDTIRNTHVTQKEAGGITQHIGASEVVINGKKIVFLDTPGHEAFTEMRARGAEVTDIVIIVVAADDGIMPQTIEAINHVKAAKVPMIIAINKIDVPTANVERVRQELAEQGVLVESYGGTIVDVPLSAKKGINIDNLLEMVLLVAEMEDLKANPNRRATGTVIEARLDKGKGSIATMIVQNGTLKVGDSIVLGTAYGRIRGMINSAGKKIKSAGPSTAVEIQGLSEVPEAGDAFYVARSDKEAKTIAMERTEKKKAEFMRESSKISLEDLFQQMQSGNVKELNIIVKADVQGSIDAISKSLEKLSNEEVVVRVIHSSVGAISESDVMLASASNAIIIGFNVRPATGAKSLAEREKVDIRTYRVIYDAIEDIEKAMKGMLSPKFEERELGKARVRETFKVPKVGIVAGAYVIEGKISRNAKARLVRDGIVIYEGTILSLRRFKDDVKEVATGYECGIGLTDYNDIKPEDIIENYIIQEIKAE